MIQLQALNKVLLEDDITLITQNGVDIENFDEYEEEYKFIVDHFNQYGNVPDDETMLGRFEGFKLLDVKETPRYIVEKLQEDRMFNEMIPILNDISTQMQVDAFEAVKEGAPRLMELMKEKAIFGGVDIAKNAGKRFEWAEKIAEHDGMLGLPTGFKMLDEITGGLLPGEELFVISARPGVGKSWLMDAIAANVWNNGNPVLMYSGEMSENLVGSRVDTILSHVPNSGITRGKLTDKEWHDYDDHISFMENSGVPFIVSTPEHLGDMLNVITLEALVQKYKPKAVFVDQLSLMREDYPTKKQTREKYMDMTKALFNLSAKHKIPVVLNVQANRSAANTSNGIPELEMLAESDGIGQNASRVLGMSMETDLEAPIMTLGLVKNRYGVSNKLLEILWDVENGLLKDLAVRNIGEETEEDEEYFSKPKQFDRPFKPKNSNIDTYAPREGIEAF